MLTFHNLNYFKNLKKKKRNFQDEIMITFDERKG